MAAAAGWWTSRRLLRPLDRITGVAGEIAAGSLDTRVALEGDPDLDRLAESFNEMADTVQARIEREARFASDVSHELRSPITALAAAAEVINGRRGELPDRTQQALDVVVGQVRRFDAMVIDLLELSRIDAGATDLHTEEVDVVALCRRIAARNGFPDLPIDVDSRAPTTVVLDRLRFERIVANLLENAEHHGGGPVRISIEPDDGPVRPDRGRGRRAGRGPGRAGPDLRALRPRQRRPPPHRDRARPGPRRRARRRPGWRGVGGGPPRRRRPLRHQHPDGPA